jgi:hypothetical protein
MARSSVAPDAATAAAATATATTAAATATAKAAAKAATKAAIKAAVAAVAAATTTTECIWLSRGCIASTQKITVMGGLNDEVLRTQAAHLLFCHSNECHTQDCSLLMERLWIKVSG